MAKIARDAVLIKQNHARCVPFEEKREDLAWLSGFDCITAVRLNEPWAGANGLNACSKGME